MANANKNPIAPKKSAKRPLAKTRKPSKKTESKRASTKKVPAKKNRSKLPKKPASPRERKNSSLSTVQATANALRSYALALPGAYEDFPWGERVIKVNKKVFVFLGRDEDIGFSVKLPVSADLALSLAFASPTGYGLGKSGWVSISPPPDEIPPLEMLTDWIQESYRAIAPKKLIAELDCL